MKRTRLLALAGGLLVLFAASIVASPYWELRRIRAAVASHDADAVAAHVDFPALRASVKDQLAAVVGKDSARADANPLAAMGQAMALAFLDPMVDAIVSPAGVIAMMENGRVSVARNAGREDRRRADPGAAHTGYALSYRAWDRVALTSQKPDGGSFLFARHGLWDWKLAGIELPR
jgi:CubicO group peptidase (beta-lactamase class C family)